MYHISICIASHMYLYCMMACLAIIDKEGEGDWKRSIFIIRDHPLFPYGAMHIARPLPVSRHEFLVSQVHDP